MSYLPTLVQSLAGLGVGSLVTIDDVRWEFEYAQIPDPAHGPTFAEAVQKGYLTTTGQTRKTRHRAGRGRLIRVYKITSKAVK